MTAYFDKAKQYFLEVRVELKKVTWLKRAEVMSVTAVVLITVFVIAIFLGIVDIGLANIIKKIIR